MPDPSSHTFTAGGLQLHYVAWGDPAAKPIVMLHGLRAYAHWFDEFAEAAAGRYRLIALDQRGRGASDRAPDGDYTTDAYVADLEALRKHLGLPTMTLMGHSMGGTNVINYAAMYPQHLEALVIIDSAPELHHEGLSRIRAELGRTPKRFDTLADARTFLRGLHQRASDANIETRLTWMLREGEGGYVWRIDNAIFDPRLTPDPPERTWSALRKISCPTLIVRGALSDLVTQDVVERMLACIPASRPIEIPAAAHMVVEDNPDGFNAGVLPFLDEVLLKRAAAESARFG
jgi:pimeloyl-ACP methyl ester carboxylesterase